MFTDLGIKIFIKIDKAFGPSIYSAAAPYPVG